MFIAVFHQCVCPIALTDRLISTFLGGLSFLCFVFNIFYRAVRYCPYVAPIFTAEKIDMEDPAAARVAPSNGKVATWTNKDVGKWLKEVQLGQFAEDFEKRGVNGPLLLTLEDNELSELGVTSTFDKHKLRFELGIARSQVTDEDRDQFVDPADSKTELSKPGELGWGLVVGLPRSTPCSTLLLLLLLLFITGATPFGTFRHCCCWCCSPLGLPRLAPLPTFQTLTPNFSLHLFRALLLLPQEWMSWTGRWRWATTHWQPPKRNWRTRNIL